MGGSKKGKNEPVKSIQLAAAAAKKVCCRLCSNVLVPQLTIILSIAKGGAGQEGDEVEGNGSQASSSTAEES